MKVATVALRVFVFSAPSMTSRPRIKKVLHPANSNTSCGPRYGCTVLFGLHTQSGNTRGLAVRVHVEIVGVDACSHARRSSKQATHVSLSHMASRTWYPQKIRHPACRMGVWGHTGSHSVAGHNTAGDRRCCTAATDPRGVLNLKY